MAERKQDAEDALNALHNITICCICTETYTDPRMLPCSHTYCFKCLPTMQKANVLHCALCRKQFDNLSANLEDLPKNVNIQELLGISQKIRPSGDGKDDENATNEMIGLRVETYAQAKNHAVVVRETTSEEILAASNLESYCVTYCDRKNDVLKKNDLAELEEVKIFCDVCKENSYCSSESESDIKSATMRCMDCCENQCAECSGEHKRQRLSKNHQIVEIDQRMKETILKETMLVCDVCAENNDNGVTDLPHATQHCIDCTENQCDQCSKEHKRQRSSKNHRIIPLDAEIKQKLKQRKEAEESRKQSNQADQCTNNADHPTEPSVRFCNDIMEKDNVTKAAPVRRENTSQDKNAVKDSLRMVGYEREPRSLVNKSRKRDLHKDQLTMTDIRPLLEDSVFSRIREVINKPSINEEDLSKFWKNAMPYIIQRLKMWNGDVITAQNLASLVNRSQKAIRSLNPASPSSEATAITERDETPVDSVSRLDCLTYIVNAADFIVAQDLLRILSKFPIPIPFVVQNISKENEYIVTTPLIKTNVVKWESTPGQIAENYLFSSPYRLVVAVRIGANKSGKSTILNQVMKKKFVFSSKGEAGSRYGKPRTLDGSVEIVWLTQETCCDITWKSTMLDFYRENKEEVAILANLHGDALQYTDTLKFLTGLAFSFIVFLMPDFSIKQWSHLKQLISGKISIHLLVDPKETTSDTWNAIYTDCLSNDETHETMRNALKESLNTEFSRKKPLDEHILSPDSCLQCVETTKCIEAEEIILIVSQTGCFKIRQILQNATVDEPRKWDTNVKRLMQLFLDILHLQNKQAKESLMLLETHLSRLTAIESANARAEVSKANERLRRFVQAPTNSNAHENTSETKYASDLKEAQENLKLAMEKVDNINLGQEHFFRVLSHIYEKCVIHEDVEDQIPSVTDLPNCFAELLINGQAIEMLNGDSGQTQLIWIKAICESVCKKLPNLKAFVISIIGLQSSGKSTLLNALFSCRFAVSVGRCSRGLFMRMIFLDDNLSKILGCDYIILIDTEGLCSPEKMNDANASHRDRLMATFAMGISNLAIVNILGEGMTEMTEILQIAIVAMARLRSGGIKPDIQMVQHLQERNVSKVDQAKGQFCEAVNKAFELINKNDIEIGSASAECLAELTARIQSGDLFQHFGPFKDGSSVNAPPSESYHEDVVSLFETVVRRVKSVEKKISFELWSHHFESYWTCVQEENFALNFKNVKHITDYLYFEKKIAKVKELLDSAFRKHSNTFALEIKEAISLYVSENKKAGLKNQEIFEGKQQQLQTIPFACPQNCDACKNSQDCYEVLLQDMSGNEWEEDTKNSLRVYHRTLQERTENVLRQIFHGSVVRQGCFFEFSDAIIRELKQALSYRPDGIYTPDEQQEITENIWRLLQGIAHSKETGIPFERKFEKALQQEYVTSGKIPNILSEFSTERSSDSFYKSKDGTSRYLRIPFLNAKFRIPAGLLKTPEDKIKFLLDDVETLITRVFQKRGDDYLISGLDFEEGMIRYIRTKFPKTVNEFVRRFSLELTDYFKLELQIYVLQQFKKQMDQLQEVWNKQNRPIDILLQKKHDYMTEIKTTLESGFTCAGEGKKVAARLGKAIEKSAMKAVYSAKVDSVQNSAWTTNSEKVRLIYFEELAKHVKSGKKERALNHFRNPEHAINEWYCKKVDSLLSTFKLLEIFNSARSKALSDILSKVQHSTSKEDIDDIIDSYITDVEDRYCCPLNPKDNDFDAYKNNIRHELSQLETEIRQVTLPSIANDPEVKRRLGCTKHCFWCGALCWGSPDHQLEKERNPEMECHHSCHQPSGLKGVSYRNTRELVSISCHIRQDTTKVWFGEYVEDEEGITWGEAKQNHFPDWKFDAHCITKFDELMRWFFQELHQDIAKSKGVLPANSRELKENRCTNLNLKDILKVVRSKI